MAMQAGSALYASNRCCVQQHDMNNIKASVDILDSRHASGIIECNRNCATGSVLLKNLVETFQMDPPSDFRELLVPFMDT